MIFFENDIPPNGTENKDDDDSPMGKKKIPQFSDKSPDWSFNEKTTMFSFGIFGYLCSDKPAWMTKYGVDRPYDDRIIWNIVLGRVQNYVARLD